MCTTLKRMHLDSTKGNGFFNHISLDNKSSLYLLVVRYIFAHSALSVPCSLYHRFWGKEFERTCILAL